MNNMRSLVNAIQPAIGCLAARALSHTCRRISVVYQRASAQQNLYTFNLPMHVSYRNFSDAPLTNFDDAKAARLGGSCWNCGKLVDGLSKFFCLSCGSVLPVNDSENYFTLLDTKRDFKVSLSELQEKFINFQRLLHPDKFSVKSALEREISENNSSLLNKAYFTLLKSLNRGLYMLELEGIFMGEDVSADDPEFLMEIMDLNERVADAESVDALRGIRNEVSAYVGSLTDKISDAFANDNISVAKACLISFKYYDNILEKLKERLPPS
ncbi:unnamed protein product [Clavelina lepadiformis]|uniref:Co-chaperone HscB C-terminal oligomerisation domain-containing protein n=1 Tax=Clavelina lepadiformis TaxID=159417 RepID=A0ABP0FD38_CLALP